MTTRASLSPFSVAGGLLLPLVLAAGCAEVPFSVHAVDNDLKTLKPTLSRIEQAKPQTSGGRAIVYVYAGPERRGEKELGKAEKTIYAYDLASGSLLFETPAEVRSRFVVAGELLIHRDQEQALVLRDRKTGAVRGRIELQPGEKLAGLAADGEVFYYSTRADTKSERRSYVTAVSTNGQQLWRDRAPGTVGAPAARGGLVAVPYRYQELVVLDGQTGAELTRIRQKDEQIGFVRASKAGFLYGVGSKDAALLTEKSTSGEKKSLTLLTPKLGERVRTFLHWDGYRAEQTDFSAFDRNRLLWDAETVSDKGGARFRDDQAVLHSYRFLFSVDSNTGKVDWAYAQPRQNLMGTDLSASTVLYAAQDGELGALDRKTGARLFAQKLPLKPGQQVLGATFDAAEFAPKGGAQPGALPPTPVLEALHNIIFDRDSSFLSVKTFAVQALNNLPGKEATSELLRVVTAEGMPAQISGAAGDALIARRDREVTGMLVEALKQSYDFLDDRRPKGVDVLARAAAAMGAEEALPVLAQRLLDPSTPPGALKEVVSSVAQLGGAKSVKPLRELLLMYRSDPAWSSDPEALRRAGEALIKHGGEPGRRTVQFVALSPRTLPPVAGHFTKLLVETAPKPLAAAVPTPKSK